MDIRIEPFLPEHVAGLEPLSLSIQKATRGPAYTVRVDGNIVACVGVMLMWPGVGTLWSHVGPEFPRIKIWATRTVILFLRDVMRAHHLHRLEACVDASSERDQRYIEFLGATRENGKARALTPDKRDAIRYEWVP